LIVAIVALVVARRSWLAAAAAATASKAANDQARADSIARSRPYVFVEAVPSIGSVHSWDLLISNAGKTAARDLTMQFDSWPDSPDNVAIAAKEMFGSARTLPPSRSIRMYWWLVASGHFEDGAEEGGVATPGVVTVYYSSDDPSEPQYCDSFPIDPYNAGLTPQGWMGPNSSKTPTWSQFYRLGQGILRRLSEIAGR
jgi:hypothetical protein